MGGTLLGDTEPTCSSRAPGYPTSRDSPANSLLQAQQSKDKKAIIFMKDGKSAGPSRIPAEAIKADMKTAINMLHDLFSRIWEEEIIPRFERRNPHKDTKKGRSYQLQQLQGNFAALGSWESSQPNSTEQDE